MNDYPNIKKNQHSILQKISNVLMFKKNSNDSAQLKALQEIINILPGHVYWYDKQGIFYGANNHQAKAFGLSSSKDLVGKNGYEMIRSKAALDEMRMINEKIYQTGQMLTVEEHGVFFDDNERTFLSQKLPWRNENGEIIGIIGISLDITERKKFERELLIYAQIINALPGYVYWKDRDGIYLGCNLQQAKGFGFSKGSDIAGMTDYDLCPSKSEADFVRKVDKMVMETDRSTTQEEPYTFNGRSHVMLSQKTPLKDEAKKIIGVLGISFDMTEEASHKNELIKEKLKAEVILKNVLNLIPVHVYWKDREGTYLGCNDAQAKSLGFENSASIIGKTDFDLPWKNDAKTLRENDLVVMGQKKTITFEEEGEFSGKHRIAISQKTPLEDGNGNVYGVLGVSIDITDRKERERLEIEREADKKILEAREKFKIKAQQVAHDINSPLGGLMMIIARLDPKKPISEADRLSLQEALGDIRIVADELVNYDKIEADPEAYKKDKPQSLPMSVTLAQFLAVKKSEYKNIPIKLESNVSDKAYAAFIQIEPTAFKRSLSNIINNAKDAFEGKPGLIKLKLDATKSQVKITVEDNGKGIPPDVVEKIMSKISVTSDKAEGHGFGMAQVSDTLARNHGTLTIDSVVGKGTKVTLTFPRINASPWFAEELMMAPEDIIIVLDDDGTMHKGWDARLAQILAEHPKMRIEHFEEGEAALSFINNLSPEDKQKVFLLTDYELLGQSMNGLDAVEQAKVARAFLVTSHYGKQNIQERAVKLGTKIIPKQSAVEIPIKIDDEYDYSVKVTKPDDESLTEEGPIRVIVVDDNAMFAKQLGMFFSMQDKNAKCYLDPRIMLKEIHQFPKDIKICIDNNFDGDVGMNGIEVAAKLHDLGYTQLYLFSGDSFAPGELPDYLTAILKTDPDFVGKIFG